MDHKQYQSRRFFDLMDAIENHKSNTQHKCFHEIYPVHRELEPSLHSINVLAKILDELE